MRLIGSFKCISCPSGFPWVSLACLWLPLGRLWVPLAPFGATLGSLLLPWGDFGLPLAVLWGPFGLTFGFFGSSGVTLGSLWVPLGPLWGPFGAHWAASGQALARVRFECLRDPRIAFGRDQTLVWDTRRCHRIHRMRCHQLQHGTPLPHAPGAMMTVVTKNSLKQYVARQVHTYC